MPNHHPIIDTHIHLFPASELDTLAWQTPTHPLASQHSVTEYKSATRSATSNTESATTTTTSSSSSSPLRGFIFLETDRISSASAPENWTHPLAEVSFISRIATGTPRAGEGHTPADAPLCLAIIPWAPLPAGAAKLGEYVDRVRETAGEAWGKVKGFRYLVQDKPRGTMGAEGFVEGLRWLGERGFVFELGVDFRGEGGWQVDEAVGMLEGVCGGEGGRVRVVINHMCKPNMLDHPSSPSYAAWQLRMARLASFPNTYMKLSGGFSEIHPLPKEEDQLEMDFWSRHAMLAETTAHIGAWMSEVLELWGAERCMFGSDWPVSNIGGGGNGVAWANWVEVVKGVVGALSEEERGMVWGGTAERVYGIGKGEGGGDEGFVTENREG